MAISAQDSVKALLKAYYKDGVENLLWRNSPVLKEIKKERVEGKTYNFSTIASATPAVSGDFTLTETLAAEMGQNAEFVVSNDLGQVFSAYTLSPKEVLASKTNAGAYMKVAGAKMFAASEALRKVLAATLYGRGFGELCFATASETVGTTASDITMPEDAIMKIFPGARLVVKSSVEADSTGIEAALVVQKVNGNKVNVIADTSYTLAGTDVICYAGAMDAAGQPLLPMGLAAWLPKIAKRTTATWSSYIGTDFCGVDRSNNVDGLAGAFYEETSSTAKKVEAIQALLTKCRRQGSEADLIVMNDEDWLEVSKEIESSNTYFTQTSTKSKKDAVIGMNEIGASFSTNYIDNVYDDPYCPKGEFYILDKEAVSYIVFTNATKVNDGVAGNNPGKPNVLEDGADLANEPMKLLIDDFVNIKPAQSSTRGPTIQISLLFYGNLIITNPSICGTGLFYDSHVVSTSL